MLSLPGGWSLISLASISLSLDAGSCTGARITNRDAHGPGNKNGPVQGGGASRSGKRT